MFYIINLLVCFSHSFVLTFTLKHIVQLDKNVSLQLYALSFIYIFCFCFLFLNIFFTKNTERGQSTNINIISFSSSLTSCPLKCLDGPQQAWDYVSHWGRASVEVPPEELPEAALLSTLLIHIEREGVPSTVN